MSRLRAFLPAFCQFLVMTSSFQVERATSFRFLSGLQLLFAQSEANLALEGLSSPLNNDEEKVFITTTALFLNVYLPPSKHQVTVQIVSQEAQSNGSGVVVDLIITMDYYYDSSTMSAGPISFHSELQDLFDSNSAYILVESLQTTGLECFATLTSISTTSEVKAPLDVIVKEPTLIKNKNGFSLLVFCIVVLFCVGMILSVCLACLMIRQHKRK